VGDWDFLHRERLLSFNKPFFFQAIDCVVWIRSLRRAAWRRVLCLVQVD
jgi:hypothetical protein